MVRSRWISGTGLTSAMVGLFLVVALVVIRNGPLAAVAAAPADAQLDLAATNIESALRGSGFSFTVVSRSTLQARSDGPKIEVPDLLDPSKTTLADEYYVGASIATGFVTPDGYFLQMRSGPATADEKPDFERAQTTLAALVSGGKTYRNDGEGWYETDQLPGIGLDPRTISLLPTLLREATGSSVEGTKFIDGSPVSTLKATGKVGNAPGLMAIDAESFTEVQGPLEFAMDPQGRLVELRALLRNTREETFDLIVDTVIGFSYGDPGPLPQPVPTWNPPAPEGEN